MEGAAQTIGASVKGRLARKELEEQSRAATIVQSRVRGKAARRATERMAAEHVINTETAKLKRTKSNSKVLKVNEYNMGKELGKGAFGQVWKATKGKKEDEQVAIKMLSRSILKRKRVGRFGSAYDSVMGEIAVMKQLNHPNVVQLYEVIDDPDEDLLFLVMELVPGGDLSEPIKAKRHVPEAELRLWLAGLTLGLEHLHLCGVCHRDIKPENVLWDPSTQEAKLTDFGISTLLKSDGVGGDFLQSTGGSYPFFAPEMCRSLRGAGYSGRAADMWACGVSLWMWLYTDLPYDADSVPDMMQKIANEEVPYPPADDPRNAGRSESLLKLLRGLLERKPKMRHRIRDLRRDAFITDDGRQPLPEPVAVPQLQSAARVELSNAVKKVQLMNRAEGAEPAAAPAPVAEVAE